MIDDRDHFIRDVILTLQDDLVRDWFTFGLQLNLSYKELHVLQLNSLALMDQRYCFRQMIVKWVNKLGSDATWSKLADALKIIGENDLARQINNDHMRLVNVCTTMEQQQEETEQQQEKEKEQQHQPYARKTLGGTEDKAKKSQQADATVNRSEESGK